MNYRTFRYSESPLVAEAVACRMLSSNDVASNDFGCIYDQIWKEQCRMKAYIAINQNKWYRLKLYIKLVTAMKNFFYIRYAT